MVVIHRGGVGGSPASAQSLGKASPTGHGSPRPNQSGLSRALRGSTNVMLPGTDDSASPHRERIHGDLGVRVLPNRLLLADGGGVEVLDHENRNFPVIPVVAPYQYPSA